MGQKRPNLWPQTKSVWRQQGAGKSKVRFHLQSHSLYKDLTMHYPHQSPNQLHHAEEESMPPAIKFFAKAIAFTPDDWATAESLSLYAPLILFYQAFMSILATWLAIWFSAEFGYSSPLCGHSLATFPIVKKNNNTQMTNKHPGSDLQFICSSLTHTVLISASERARWTCFWFSVKIS